jgi:octaprenyl-diphosphate synthase
MQNIFNSLQKDLNKVIKIMDSELKGSENSFLSALLSHLNQSRGKLLRPSLAICSARLRGEPASNFYLHIAAALEILHTASLVHDDIIDRAELRRGVPSICHRYGNGEAVLLGDWLLAKSFTMITAIENINILKDSSQLFSELTEGQFMEMNFKNQKSVTENDYLRMIDLKTSSVFRWACSGAVHCNPDFSAEDAGKLKIFGSCFGALFQITDDIIDIKSNRENAGKNTGYDLKNGLITLPVIKGLQIEKDRGENHLKKAIETRNEDFFQTKLADYLEENGALTACRQKSLELRNQAFESLSGFPDSPQKETLKNCTDFALNQI